MTWYFLVELLRRYSNRRDLVEQLTDVVRRIEQNDQTEEPGLDEPGHNSEPRQSFGDRLSDEETQALIAAYRGGMTGSEVAAAYGVSLSTVKRLLRKHNVRLSDLPPP